MRSMFIAMAVTTVCVAAIGASAAPLTPPRTVGAQPLVVQVQGRACRACRADCYYTYRTACGYSQSCRTAFTRCMRVCWEDYCR